MREARIGAVTLKTLIPLHVHQPARALEVGFVQPLEDLFSVAQAGINDGKVISGDIALRATLRQLREDFLSLALPPSGRVSVRKTRHRRRHSFRHLHRLFEWSDRLLQMSPLSVSAT